VERMDMTSILNYFVENTGFIVQIFIYIVLGIYVLLLIKPKKKASLDEVFNENDSSMTLTKEDKKYMKMADDKVLRLLIPKPGSKSYVSVAKKFDRINGSEKYKNLTLFFVKRAYFTFLTIVAVIVVNCIPLFIYLLQQWIGIENPQLITLPRAFVIISLIAPIIMYLYPNLELQSALKKRDIALQKEVISLGIMVHTMLETGNSPYDILLMIKDIKPVYKEYIETALNEYYVNTKAALENLKTKIGLTEFDMIVDSLIYAYETDNTYAARFLNEYITRLEQTSKISSEKSNKIKPYILLVSSILPLISALVIWFYPWLVQAIDSLSRGLTL
jgi:hypothetical protein